MIVDTAGRLHVKAHLIEELKKIARVIGREMPVHHTKPCWSSMPRPDRTPSTRHASSAKHCR